MQNFNKSNNKHFLTGSTKIGRIETLGKLEYGVISNWKEDKSDDSGSSYSYTLVYKKKKPISKLEETKLEYGNIK